MTTAIDEAVRSALRADPAVVDVRLAGSRAAGRQTPLSDWDFVVETTDFARTVTRLPALVAALDPLAQQWDRLGPDDYRCYMLLLRGPTKVDLIFPGERHVPEPPWTVAPETLEGIDRHLWDWVLWMASKRARGQHELVRTELRRLHRHLLAPMGVDRVPGSIHDAVTSYVRARASFEDAFGLRVPRLVEDEVRQVLAA
jgi:predicted nucleotidyltransferase